MLKKFLVVLVGLFASLSVFATSISLLKGDNFRDDLGYRSDKTTYTIEHFGMWELGTVFFYYDITEPTTDDKDSDAGPTDFDGEEVSNQFFGGTSVTFSFSKMTDKKVAFGPITDVSIRLELENGSGNGGNNFNNYFYGLQYDVAIPGFDFFMFNTVIRDNPESRGVGFQIGSAWQVTWDYGRWNKWKFTGFLATSPWDGDIDPEKEGPKSSYGASNRGRFLTTQPQFLYDLGYGLWSKPDRLEVGVEYAYFINRFQLRERDEKCLQAMVKASW